MAVRTVVRLLGCPDVSFRTSCVHSRLVCSAALAGHDGYTMVTLVTHLRKEEI